MKRPASTRVASYGGFESAEAHDREGGSVIREALPALRCAPCGLRAGRAFRGVLPFFRIVVFGGELDRPPLEKSARLLAELGRGRAVRLVVVRSVTLHDAAKHGKPRHDRDDAG